jgi:hypothetical protein
LTCISLTLHACAFHELNPSHYHTLFTKMLATLKMVYEQFFVHMRTLSQPSHCHILFTKMLATFELAHEQLLVHMPTLSQDGTNHSLS